MAETNTFSGLTKSDQIRLETRKDAFVRTLECAIFEGENCQIDAMKVLLADAGGMAQSLQNLIAEILRKCSQG